MDSGFGREVYKFSVDFVLNADGRNKEIVIEVIRVKRECMYAM